MQPAPTNHYLSYGLAARIALLVQACVTVFLAWRSPESLTAKLVAAGGSDAVVALWVFSCCTALAVLDMLINDLAPAPFTARPLLTRRHLVYSGLGAGYVITVFAGVSPTNAIPGSGVLLWAYVAFGASSLWYSTVCALRGSHDAQT
jgi:hypothetical protein